MNSLNDFIDHPIRSTTSKDVTGLQKPESIPLEGLLESSPKIDAMRIEHLPTFDSNILRDFLEKKIALETEIQRAFAASVIPVGIYKENGKTFYVIPSSWGAEDCILGALVADFAKESGAEVRTIDAPVNKTQAYDKKFVAGLWFGLFSSTNQKRRRAKQSYEMGRTCTFSLIVKNVFEQNSQLGSAALARDNFFFGNNPTEVSNKSRVPFYLKMKLAAFFDKLEYGSLLYGIINHTCAAIGMTYLKDDEREKVISDNLLPVDHLITSCYPTVHVKKGRQEATKVRKPNPPRSSPLFTKDEMTIISKMTSLIFTDLGSLSRQYEATVFAQGFSNVSERIREIINVRWETLQRFAHVTKERLQDIRRISNDPRIRKASVTRDHVKSLIDSESDPADRLVSELTHILGRANLNDCFAFAFRKTLNNHEQVKRYLYVLSLDVYKKMPDLKFLSKLVPKYSAPDPNEVDYQKGVKLLLELEAKIGALKQATCGLRSIKYFKIFGRLESIKALITSISKTFTSLERVQEASIEIAVQLFYERKYQDVHAFVDQSIDSLSNLLTSGIKHLTYRRHEESDDNVLRIITDLLETLESGKDSFLTIRETKFLPG
jgi:hypothetical protein